jgi:transmembrane sensor
MKKYEDFGVEDFVCDDKFIYWCLTPDEESIRFWQGWIKNHPYKYSIIQSAKQIVLDLHSIEKKEQEENFEKTIWEQIEKNIEQPKVKKYTLNPFWRNTAAVAVVLLIAFFTAYRNLTPLNVEQEAAIVTQWVNEYNPSANVKSIILADGSKVFLEPFSSLKYPTTFTRKQREVFLQGEAFFDIAKDTTKPFVIYANETITKVLGTSFTIKAFEGEKTVEVEVKTGTVAVYAKVAPASKQTIVTEKKLLIETDERIILPLPNKKLVVTPNQKVIFDHAKEEMIKTVIKAPKIIKRLDELPQFHFKNHSIVEVFEILELAYGIDLEFDKEKFKNCTITTSLGNETLFEKLNIICLALNLKITEQEAVIFIKGDGC